MCGIAGIFSQGPPDPALLDRMGESIRHRGPDDSGEWHNADSGIGFAHRRLSIIDLSPLGHQPMESHDGRYVIAYNGELYNHIELRAELDASCAPAWRGRSDTETLIEAIAAWGLAAALRKCAGMFAIALWDRRERELSLARDRFGEKPLYYGWVGGDFVFGSELKAIRLHPRFDNPIDRNALRLFAGRSYIPAPLSIYRRIYKLAPASILTLSRDAIVSPMAAPPEEGCAGPVKLERFWSYRDKLIDGLRNPIRDHGEALEQLEATFATAVRQQVAADVPVGVFLSGGIDSSTIVALCRKYTSGPVETFTVGFLEAGFNEAEHAKRVAGHFGTRHHEHYVDANEARDVIPLLPTMYDEPFADSSQIPTHLVSRFARAHVTVALSGDGGDELFGGYNRYVQIARMWSALRRLPGGLRFAVSGGAGLIPPAAWNFIVGIARSERPPAFYGSRVQRAFQTMARTSHLADVIDSFLDEWSGCDSPVGMLDTQALPPGFDLDLGPGAPETLRMMYADAMAYLPGDILCKVDRASMAVSLETRAPFLDHRLAELVARIPIEMKIRGGQGKVILRELLHRHAPAQLFDRPKAGFAVPVGEWIRGPLRAWAEDLLSEGALRKHGYFEPRPIRARWKAHLSGVADHAPSLWAVLMAQAWLTSVTAH